jgi:hydrogenase maturation protease
VSAGTVVVGIGNPYRHDDGIGPLVAELVDAYRLAGVTAVPVGDADPTLLIEAWAGAELAVVVDAALCRPSHPGRIHRVIPGECALDGYMAATASTHHLSLAEALRLSAALEAGPERLVVLAVEAADVSIGEGLSPMVAAAVPRVLGRVLAEIVPAHAPAR